MIDTGVITGKEEFGVYVKYLPKERRHKYFHSPKEFEKDKDDNNIISF